MSYEYIVLENIPNTPEGRAFLKLLRKYLRPQYRMRSRGRHKDRKGLAERLVREGIVKNDRPHEVELTDKDLVSITHLSLRTGMSCKYADRITTVIEARNERGIRHQAHDTLQHKKGYYVDMYSPQEAQGPFKTWEAACLAQAVTKGTTK